MGRALDRALRLSRMDAGAGWRGMPGSHRGDAERIGANDRAMVPAPDAPARPSRMARGSTPRGGVRRPGVNDQSGCYGRGAVSAALGADRNRTEAFRAGLG